MHFWEEVVEASPILIDATAHDRQLAWTSHLPQSVASALAKTLADRGLAGLSSIVDDEEERRRGYVRIVSVGDVCEVVKSAEKAMQTAPRPAATHLPVEPLRPFPADALDAAVKSRQGGLNPYQISSSGFDIAFLTPVLIYAAQHAAQPARDVQSRQVVATGFSGSVLTDDRAPVEWLADRAIVSYVAHGGRLQNDSLPTAP